MAPSKQKSSRSSRRPVIQNSDIATTKAKQPTISKCFTNTAHKPLNGENNSLSPGAKRRKLNSPFEDSFKSISKPVTMADMYNFPSSNPNVAVVDLTKSPPTTPRSRRVSSGGSRMESFSQYTGPKKIIVKNLRTTSKSNPDDYYNKTSGQLDAALTAIFAGQKPILSNEELYRGSEHLCKLGRGPELASKLFARCKDHISMDLKKNLVEQAGDKDVDVLRAVLAAWTIWNKQLFIIRGIFFYLDRAYLLQKQQASIYDTTIAQFRTLIFNDAMLKPKIVDGACDLVLADRSGQAPGHDLFKDTIKMLHELSVYTEYFEPRMLELSQTYIAAWAEKECTETSLPEYVEASVKFIDSEMRRCTEFDLDSTTSRALLILLEHHIIERRQEELVDADGVAGLLDDNEQQKLEQLFSLLQRRRLGGKLCAPFATWIEDTGTAIVFDDKQQDSMVQNLLELKTKLDNLWRMSFHKHEELGHALRESFALFINKTKKTSATWNTDNSKPGEMIAKYVDSLLRTGAKAIPKNLASSTNKCLVVDEEDNEEEAFDEDSAVNSQLDQVLDLFRFVHGKSVFEAFYKKDLARRLLMGRSASNDAEISMLARLKAECGANFTSNLEQMFKDVELSREEMSAYKGRLQQNDRRSDIDLNVNILSAAAWPSYPEIPVAIPPEIKLAVDSFEQYYNQKHSGRKLQWKHALAHCQLSAAFPKGKKELVVSSFQAIVLLLFNHRSLDEHLSYEQIKAETGLSEAEAKRTLQSLACAKLRPLTKHPKSRDVNASDTFTLNASFSHERYRVKINAIQLRETAAENRETHERVAADRQYETQAAIVRIMKGRKVISHAELVAEVISATRSRGVLSIAEIKKNIDRLIEKEYMERGEDGNYEYLA